MLEIDEVEKTYNVGVSGTAEIFACPTALQYVILSPHCRSSRDFPALLRCAAEADHCTLVDSECHTEFWTRISVEGPAHARISHRRRLSASSGAVACDQQARRARDLALTETRRLALAANVRS